MTRIFPILAAIAAVVTLAACDQLKSKDGEAAGAAKPKPPVVQYGEALAKRVNALFGDTLEKRAGTAGDQAADHARNAMSSGGYEQAVGDSDCTDDCAGHDAGFATARAKKIENPNNCPNDRGDAFEEGCRAYGETIQGARDDAHGAVMNGKEPPS
jgi:hypothetical protein